MEALEDLQSCDLDDVLKELDSLELHFNAELNSLMSSSAGSPNSSVPSEVTVGTLKRPKLPPPPPTRRSSSKSNSGLSPVPNPADTLQSDPVYLQPHNSLGGSVLHGVPPPVTPTSPLRVPISPRSPVSPIDPCYPDSSAASSVAARSIPWSDSSCNTSKTPPLPVLPKPKRLPKPGNAAPAVLARQSPLSAEHTPATDKARTGSPDSDSAFCDDVSTFSESSVSSNTGSGMTCGVRREDGATVLTIVSEHPGQTGSPRPPSPPDDKMKSTLRRVRSSADSLLVKVHFEDGSTKCVAVDGTMTCGRAVALVAEKRLTPLSDDLVLVEVQPLLERMLEDHEVLAEQLTGFSPQRGQQLWFVRRPLRHDVFLRPERHLLAEACSVDDSQPTYQMDESARADLVQDKFEMGGYVPGLEGHLWLKADGKKSWKRMLFSLKVSGLFYSPKGILGTMKSHHLCNPEHCQIYSGVDWREQLKAPTQFGLALRTDSVLNVTHHLCAETESSWHRWHTALRLAKHGAQLLTNFKQLRQTSVRQSVPPQAHMFVDRRPAGPPQQQGDLELPPPPAQMMDELQAERRRVRFSDEQQSLPAPPPEFLSHLQSVIHRKWTVAEKCRTSSQLPHQVLGFQQHTGQGDKEAQVGRWLRQHYGD